MLRTGYTGNYYYNILHFTNGASSGKAGHKSPALYIHGGNWWSGPGLKASMDSKPSPIYSRIYSIQRNRIYDVLLTQTKHLNKVISVEGKLNIIFTSKYLQNKSHCCSTCSR